MKKIMLMALILQLPLYAMNPAESRARLFHSDTELQVAQSLASDDSWRPEDHSILNSLLINTIDHKNFQNARELINIGATIPTSYGEIKFIQSICVKDQETFNFLLEQEPPLSIMQKALIIALDKKHNSYALQLLDHGATLPDELSPEKITEYNTQLAEFIAPEQPAAASAAEGPQAQEMPIARQIFISLHEETSNAVESLQSLINGLWS